MTLQPHLTLQAEKTLETLMGEVQGAVSAVLSTVDGFAVAVKTDTEEQGARVAAMASSISAICSVVGEETEVGAHHSITIQSENGYVVMVQVAHAVLPMILKLVANKTAVLGQMIYFARQAAKQLAEAALKC